VRRAILPALAVIASLALALPGAASAAESSGPPPQLLRAAAAHGPMPAPRPFVQPTISLGEQSNYKVEVFGRQGRVLVLVYRGERMGALYAAPGTATSTRLEADFGELGRISMRFRVSRDRSWERPQRNCRGKQRFVNRRGVFTGGLRFRGERGYVSFRVRRIKGYVTAVAPQCQKAEGGGVPTPLAESSATAGPSPLPASLRLTWLDGVESGFFVAAARRKRTGFFAEVAETSGRIGIFRFAQAFGGPRRLRIDEALTTARTNPPSPFSGNGIYRAAADGSFTWGGTLAVNFPGAPRTPLTDRPFRAQVNGGI
jgi:hypothetical protein